MAGSLPTISRFALLACAGFACAWLAPASVPPAHAQSLGNSQPWIMPFDINRPTPKDPAKKVRTQRQVYDFMWQTFVAINWPQKCASPLQGYK